MSDNIKQSLETLNTNIFNYPSSNRDERIRKLRELPLEQRMLTLLHLINMTKMDFDEYKKLLQEACEHLNNPAIRPFFLPFLQERESTVTNFINANIDLIDRVKGNQEHLQKELAVHKRALEVEIERSKKSDATFHTSAQLIRQLQTEKAQLATSQIQSESSIAAQRREIEDLKRSNQSLTSLVAAAASQNDVTTYQNRIRQLENELSQMAISKMDENSSSSSLPLHTGNVETDRSHLEFVAKQNLYRLQGYEHIPYNAYIDSSGTIKLKEYCDKTKVSLPVYQTATFQSKGETLNVVGLEWRSKFNTYRVFTYGVNAKVCSHTLTLYLFKQVSFEPQSGKDDHYTTRMRLMKEKRYAAQQRDFVKANRDMHLKDKHSLIENAHEFDSFFESHGYKPHLLKKVPSELILRALHLYIAGYGLLHLGYIHRKNVEHINLFGVQLPANKLVSSNVSPQGGAKRRKVIVATWRCYVAKQHGISFTGFFQQSGKGQSLMGGLVGDALKDVVTTHSDEFKALGGQIADGVMDGIKAKFMSVIDSVGKSIETKLGVTPAHIKAGLIFLIVCCVLLTCFSLATFVLMAKTIFDIKTAIDVETESWKQQSGEEEEENVKQFMVEAMGSIVGKSSGVSMKDFVSSVNNSSRFVVSLTNLAGFAKSCWLLLKKAIDFCSQKLTGFPFFSDSNLAFQILDEYEKFFVTCQTLNPDDVYKNRSVGTDFIARYMSLVNAFKNIDKTGIEPHVISRMQTVLLGGYRRVQEVRVRLGACKGRQQPVWINFFGVPKQGKTLLQEEIPKIVAQIEENKQLAEQHIYMRNPMEEFWSGYNGNVFGVRYNDLFQNKDPQVMCKLANELIFIRDCIPYPLNMADIDNKGCTWFEAPIVTSSMNAPMHKVPNLGLLDPNALFRRVDFDVYVELKPGVTPQRTNRLSPDITDNFQLLLVNREGQTPSGTKSQARLMKGVSGVPITFESLVELICEQYNINKSSYLNSAAVIDWRSKFSFAKNKTGPLIGSANPPAPPPGPQNPPTQGPPPGPPSPSGGGNSSMSSSSVSVPAVKVPQTFAEFKQGLETDFKNTVNSAKAFFNLRSLAEKNKYQEIEIIPSEVVVDPIQTSLTTSSLSRSTTEDIVHGNTGFEPQGPKPTRWNRIGKFINDAVTPWTDAIRQGMCPGGDKCVHWKDRSASTVLFHNKYVVPTLLADAVCRLSRKGIKDYTNCCYLDLKGDVENFTPHNDLSMSANEVSLFKKHFSAVHHVWWTEDRVMTSEMKFLVKDVVDPVTSTTKSETILYPNWHSFGAIRQKTVANTASELDHKRISKLLNLGEAVDEIPWFELETGVCSEAFAKKYGREIRKRISDILYHDESLIRSVSEFNYSFPRYLIPARCKAIWTPFANEPPINSLQRLRIIDGEEVDKMEKTMVALAEIRQGWKIFGMYALVFAIILLVTGTFAIIGLRGYFEPQSGKYEDQKNQLNKQIKARHRNNRPKFHQQSGDLASMTTQDSQAQDLARIILSRNLEFVEIIDGLNGKMNQSWILMVKGNMGVGPLHALEPVPNPAKAKFFYGEKADEWKEALIVNVRRDSSRDLAIYTFTGLSPYKDLTPHMSDEPLPDRLQGPARLSYDLGVDTVTLGSFIEKISDSITYRSGRTTVKNAYKIPGFPNQVHDCGKPYIFFNPKVEKKLRLLHVAGNGSDALAVPIYKKDFEDANLTAFDTPVYSEELYDEQCPAAKILSYSRRRECERRPALREYLMCSRRPPNPQKHNIVKTVVATGVHVTIKEKQVFLDPPFEITEAPSCIKPTVTANGIVDPHRLAYRKLKGRQIPAPPAEMFTKSDIYKGMFSDNISHHWVRPLTIEEAVFGIPSLGIPGIDLSTSPGFPWVLMGIKRTDLVDKDKKWISPDLIREVKFLVRMSISGKIVPHVTVHCLKIETLLLEKVLAGHSRAFQIGSIQHLIFHRMALSFWVFQTEHDQGSDISVGVNVYSTQWDEHFAHITKFNDCDNTLKLYARDVSGWDLFFPEYVPQFTHVSVIKTYQIEPYSEHSYMIWASLHQTINGLILFEDGLLCWAELMRSGTFLTSFLNSAWNSISERVCFHRLTHHVQSIASYDQVVASKKFGDDSIGGADKSVHRWWNCQSIALMAKQLFGQIQTSPNKDANMPEFFTLEQVDYLCRKFVTDPESEQGSGYMFAQLSLNSIRTMVQFVKKNDERTVNEQMKVNMEVALRELVYHGRAQYENHQKVFNQFLRATYQMPIEISYEDMRKIMLVFKFS